MKLVPGLEECLTQMKENWQKWQELASAEERENLRVSS